ncbi:serine hydrolase-like protein isoform X1 [Palaemon carinicauda]|uniref:serine hydrolase-like protein isoform X1 n=1 Tax=Palaemon carinicauda TaxID=392227 RepID=UPI0035B651BE
MAREAVLWSDVEVNVGWGTLRGKTCVVGGGLDGDEDLRIVGLHGWLDNCNTFDSLVPLLPSKTKVLVLDFPGHGWSDHLPLGAHYNPFVYAFNIKTAVLKLGWKKFVLMGHSMGGAVSCVFTALFPELVSSLILFDYVFPMSSMGFVEQFQVYAEDLLKSEKLALEPPLVYSEKEAIDRLIAARVFGYSDDATIDKEAAQILLPRSTREVDNGYIWSHDRKARATFLGFIRGEKWIEIISSIKCPVLLIQATRGTYNYHKEYAKKIHEIYRKNAQWFHVEVAEGCHHAHLTEPRNVAPAVNNFLEEVVGKKQIIRARL